MDVTITDNPDGSKTKTLVDLFAVVEPLKRFYDRMGHDTSFELVDPSKSDLWKLTIRMKKTP